MPTLIKILPHFKEDLSYLSPDLQQRMEVAGG